MDYLIFIKKHHHWSVTKLITGQTCFALLIQLLLWVGLWVHLYCGQWQNMQCSFKYFEQCINNTLTLMFHTTNVFVDFSKSYKRNYIATGRPLVKRQSYSKTCLHESGYSRHQHGRAQHVPNEHIVIFRTNCFGNQQRYNKCSSNRQQTLLKKNNLSQYLIF